MKSLEQLQVNDNIDLVEKIRRLQEQLHKIIPNAKTFCIL
jgi:3-dehydroquinate dehydratase